MKKAKENQFKIRKKDRTKVERNSHDKNTLYLVLYGWVFCWKSEGIIYVDSVELPLGRACRYKRKVKFARFYRDAKNEPDHGISPSISTANILRAAYYHRVVPRRMSIFYKQSPAEWIYFKL